MTLDPSDPDNWGEVGEPGKLWRPLEQRRLPTDYSAGPPTDDAWLFSGPIVTRKLPKTITLEIWGEIIGEPETAIWCDACMLPSAVTFRLVFGSGFRIMSYLTVTRCLDCGAETRTTEREEN